MANEQNKVNKEEREFNQLIQERRQKFFDLQAAGKDLDVRRRPRRGRR